MFGVSVCHQSTGCEILDYSSDRLDVDESLLLTESGEAACADGAHSTRTLQREGREHETCTGRDESTVEGAGEEGTLMCHHNEK